LLEIFVIAVDEPEAEASLGEGLVAGLEI